MHPREPDVAKNIRSHNTQAGFTLLEFAVVVVILGLLIGGLLIGRESLRQAQLRRLVSQAEEYTSALKQFRSKYQDYPGDMYNATTIWGTDPSGCPGTVNTTPKIETCNGNGNGRIYDFPAGGDTEEAFRMFQHLSSSNMIRGSFTGVRRDNAIADSARINMNVPECDVTGGALWLTYYGFNDNSNPVYFPMRGHYIRCALLNMQGQVFEPVLTAVEANGIDTKIDNGLPGSGRLVTLKGNCASTTDPVTARYPVNDADKSCLLMMGVDDLR